MPSAPPIVSANNETDDYARQGATSAAAFVAPDFTHRKARVRMWLGARGILRRALDGRDYDPWFERPDLVEDDYFRLRHHPRD